MEPFAGQLSQDEIDRRLAAIRAAHRAKHGEPKPVKWEDVQAAFADDDQDLLEQVLELRREDRALSALRDQQQKQGEGLPSKQAG